MTNNLRSGMESWYYTLYTEEGTVSYLFIPDYIWEQDRKKQKGQRAAAKVMAWIIALETAVKRCKAANAGFLDPILILEEDADTSQLILPTSPQNANLNKAWKGRWNQCILLSLNPAPNQETNGDWNTI